MERYDDICLAADDIYLPAAGVDMNKWAVVACDQYTSQPPPSATMKSARVRPLSTQKLSSAPSTSSDLECSPCGKTYETT